MRLTPALLLLLPSALAAQDLRSTFEGLPTGGRRIAVGQTQQGRLTAADPRAFDEGAHLQAWTIQPGANVTVTIDLLSDDFDAMLYLVGPGMPEPLRDDDGAGGCNSRITHTFNGGEYRLIVSTFAFAEPATGAFTLRASTDPPPVADVGCDSWADPGEFDEDWVDVTVEALNALPLSGTLRRGDSVTGSLTMAAAEIGDGRRGMAYDVTGPAGAAVTVDLSSTAFDTYLYVVHANHSEPLTDDDAGGACNSRLTLTLPESGRIRAVVSSFGGGAEGAFQLGVYREPPPARQGACGTSGRFDAAAISALPSTGTVEVGAAVAGELLESDAQMDQYYIDLWDLPGRAGETAVIELRSMEFDAYLGFTGPGIVGVMTDDDGAGRCNSRLEVVFPETGTYRIIATTFRNDAIGTYQLQVSRDAGPMDDGSCSFARESARRLRELPVRGTLEAGRSVDGRLDDTSPMLSGGSYASAWDLDVRRGEVYTVDLASRAFDTFLFAVAPDGMVSDDDDCGDDTNSRLVLRPTANGRWRIVASSYVSAEGPFTLTVTRGEPAEECGSAFGWTDEGVDYSDAPTVGQLQVGDEYRGRLGAGDARHYDGSFMHAFDLRGRAGQSATIDLVSDAFDAYLIVMGRGLPEMLTDDDSGGACNSRITLTFPESGTYRVIVNTLMGEQSGPYVLRVTATPGPLAPGDCSIL